MLYQDNKSEILLEVNGKSSSGKIIRALDICYFLMTDKVEKRNVQIKYFPIDEMWGYFVTNPTQREKFRNFKNYLLDENE